MVINELKFSNAVIFLPFSAEARKRTEIWLRFVLNLKNLFRSDTTSKFFRSIVEKWKLQTYLVH